MSARGVWDKICAPVSSELVFDLNSLRNTWPFAGLLIANIVASWRSGGAATLTLPSGRMVGVVSDNVLAVFPSGVVQAGPSSKKRLTTVLLADHPNGAIEVTQSLSEVLGRVSGRFVRFTLDDSYGSGRPFYVRPSAVTYWQDAGMKRSGSRRTMTDLYLGPAGQWRVRSEPDEVLRTLS